MNVSRQTKTTKNADHWWLQVSTRNQRWKELKTNNLEEMATLRHVNFIHSVCCAFPSDLRHSSPCQHHSSFMSIISSYNLTALTPAFSLLKLLPSGTAVLYLSTSFTCHLCANLSWEHSFSPLYLFHFPLFYLAPQRKAARGREDTWYARCYKPCLLQKTAIRGYV